MTLDGAKFQMGVIFFSIMFSECQVRGLGQVNYMFTAAPCVLEADKCQLTTINDRET